MFLLVLFALLSGSPSRAQDGYRISDVHFTGNQSFDEDVFAGRLLFPPVGWFSRTFSGDEPSLFSEENLISEADAIVRFYQEEGFIDVSVQGSVMGRDDDSRSVELLYTITEADSVVVGSVTMQFGNAGTVESLLSDSLLAVLNEISAQRPGLRFRDAQVNEDRSSILRVLNDNGFPYSTVSHQISLSAGGKEADILWNVDTGPLAYFGGYSIQGSVHFNDDLIRDRVRFPEGGLYQQSLLEETQRDIYDLGLYRVVSIRALLAEEQSDRIPVLISITESSRYRLKMGVGYGRDEKFRVSGSVDILGIFGTAGLISFEIKRSELEPFTLFVTYVHPDFLLRKARFSVKPFLRREDEPGYEARRTGYEISLSKPLWSNFYGSVGYSYESVDLYRIPDVPLPEEYRSSYPKESVIFTIGYASARPLFSPEAGVSVAISTTYSGLNLVQSDEYQFSRFLMDSRYYTSLRPWMVLAARLKVGSIRSRDTGGFVPFEERYYAGGSTSVRGWSRSTLGPLDPSGKPIGGSSLLETGLELRVPHGNPLHAVVFMDAGNVWETPLTYKLNDLGYAAGAGIRYETPIGPLRLDIAHPLFRGTQQVQWWFSIGHAF